MRAARSLAETVAVLGPMPLPLLLVGVAPVSVGVRAPPNAGAMTAGSGRGPRVLAGACGAGRVVGDRCTSEVAAAPVGPFVVGAEPATAPRAAGLPVAGLDVFVGLGVVAGRAGLSVGGALRFDHGLGPAGASSAAPVAGSSAGMWPVRCSIALNADRSSRLGCCCVFAGPNVRRSSTSGRMAFAIAPGWPSVRRRSCCTRGSERSKRGTTAGAGSSVVAHGQ